MRDLSRVTTHDLYTKITKFLSEITEYKKNDSKNDHELVGLKRKKKQEKYQAALKRSWKDLKVLPNKQVAKKLKKKREREREALKYKKDKDRKFKAEEKAVEKKAKQNAQEQKKAESATILAARKRGQVDIAKIKTIKAIIVKRDGEHARIYQQMKVPLPKMTILTPL